MTELEPNVANHVTVTHVARRRKKKKKNPKKTGQDGVTPSCKNVIIV